MVDIAGMATAIGAEEIAAMAGLGVLLGLGIAFMVLLGFAVYAYMALALMTIGQKLKFTYPWLAWIPGANIAMILAMGGFHWAWVFLVFLPIIGWIALGVMSIIATWRIFEKRKYPGWLVLLGLIPYFGGLASLIIWGMVAWSDKKKKK